MMCRGLPFSCVPKIAKLSLFFEKKILFDPLLPVFKDRQCPFSLSSTNRHDRGGERSETFFLSPPKPPLRQPVRKKFLEFCADSEFGKRKLARGEIYQITVISKHKDADF